MTKVYIVIVRSYGEFDYILGCYDSEELASEDIKNIEIIDKRNGESPNDYLIEEFDLMEVKKALKNHERNTRNARRNDYGNDERNRICTK
jgi:hypothetical protein